MDRFESTDRAIASAKAQADRANARADQAEAENTDFKARNREISAYLCNKDPAAPFCK